MAPAARSNRARLAARGLLLLLLALAGGCAGAQRGQLERRSATPGARVQRGLASYYGKKFQGRKTANGERFDNGALTAAHRTLPFGTRVRVTNERNGRSVILRINDRGPHSRGRIIDVSRRAAVALDMIGPGVVPVVVEVLR